MKNNFFGLMEEYTTFPSLDAINEEYLVLLLNQWIEHSNDKSYDIIDYELLIYLEVKFGCNARLSPLFKQLNELISENYYKKIQLRNRLVRHDDFIWEM